MADWGTKTLGELCEFQRGLTYGKSDEVDASKNVVLRANNVDLATHTLDLTDLRYISNSITIPAAKKVRKGSLLICTASGSKSHLGKIAYVDEDYGYAFGGFMGQITPAPGVDGRYLFHALTSSKYKAFIEALSDGVNINNLKFDDLRQFSVPVPPLPEQQRIVAILDEAFEAIATAKANAEKNLLNTRRLSGTVMNSLLTTATSDWIETTIGDQITLQRGFDITKDKQRNGLVPVVSSGGIRSYHDTAMVKAPGVVMGRKGTLGKVFYLEDDFWPHDTTLWVKDFKDNDPRFVYRFFEVLDVQGLDSGAANPALNRNQVHQLATKWPPKGEQAVIAESMEALTEEVRKLTAVYERKLTALDELKKSLLHQAFTGQL